MKYYFTECKLVITDLLHFVAFFLVASLLFTRVDNEKVNKIENEPKTRISGLMIRINLQVASLVFLIVL